MYTLLKGTNNAHPSMDESISLRYKVLLERQLVVLCYQDEVLSCSVRLYSQRYLNR